MVSILCARDYHYYAIGFLCSQFYIPKVLYAKDYHYANGLYMPYAFHVNSCFGHRYYLPMTTYVTGCRS